MKYLVITGLFLITGFNCLRAGDTLKVPLEFSVFNTATQFPGSGYIGIINVPVHAGIEFGKIFRFNGKQNNYWFQTLNLGYFYHRYSQSALTAYTETGFNHLSKKKLGIGGLVGGGYLHSFPAIQVFKLNSDGEYVRANRYGLAQAMVSLAFKLEYEPNLKMNNPLVFFVKYRFWLQFPFVKEYVPLLPNTALHIGIRYQLVKKNTP